MRPREIDASTADRFAACVARALAVSDHLVVDLSEATFMDSTGLAVIVAARRALHDDGRHVILHGAHGAVRRVLEVTGVDQVITLDGVAPVQDDGAPQAERDRQSSQTK